MFDLEKAIKEWRSRLTDEGITDTGRLDELESHLREDLARQTASGVPEAEALERAIGGLGSPVDLGNEFTKNPDGGYRLAVQVLAVWLVVNGCSIFIGPLRMMFVGGLVPSGRLLQGMLLNLSWVPLLLGIGLLRRGKLWRVLTLAWFFWCCAGGLGSVLVPAYRPHSIFVYAPPVPNPLVHYVVLGFPVSYNVLYADAILHAVIWVFGAWLLMTRGGRDYFASKPAKRYV